MGRQTSKLTFTYATRNNSPHWLINELADQSVDLYIHGNEDRSVYAWALCEKHHTIGRMKWAECDQGIADHNWALGEIELKYIADYLKGSNRRKLTLLEDENKNLKLITSQQGTNNTGYLLKTTEIENISTVSAMLEDSEGDYAPHIANGLTNLKNNIDFSFFHFRTYIWFVEDGIVITAGAHDDVTIIAKFNIQTELHSHLLNKGISTSILKMIQKPKNNWYTDGIVEIEDNQAIKITFENWEFIAFILDKPIASISAQDLRCIRIPDTTVLIDFLNIAANYWRFHLKTNGQWLIGIADDSSDFNLDNEEGGYLKIEIPQCGFVWDYVHIGDPEELAKDIELLGTKEITFLIDEKESLYAIQSEKGIIFRDLCNELYEDEDDYEEEYEDETDE